MAYRTPCSRAVAYNRLATVGLVKETLRTNPTAASLKTFRQRLLIPRGNFRLPFPSPYVPAEYFAVITPELQLRAYVTPRSCVRFGF